MVDVFGDDFLFILSHDFLLKHKSPVHRVHAELRSDLLLRELANGQTLRLNLRGVDTVLAIVILDDVVVRIANRSVMLDREVFHGFDELTLNISSIGRIGHAQTICKREVECGRHSHIIHLGVELRADFSDRCNGIQHNVVVVLIMNVHGSCGHFHQFLLFFRVDQ